MPIVDCGKYQLNYVEEGQGPTVLLIHGLAGDLSAWTPQIAAFKDRYRVIAFDNPGSGKSSPVSGPTSMQELADATLTLMDRLGADKAHVVGRSMGGAVAQMMALTAPERVQSIALCASLAKIDPVGQRIISSLDHILSLRGKWADQAMVGSYLFVSPRFFNENPEAMARIERLLGDESRDRASYHNLAQAIFAFDSRPRLGEIRCPTLVMGGRLDPICSMGVTEELGRLIPGAETVIFEHSSHFFLMEEAPKAMQVLGDWLARQTRAG